MPGRPHHIPVYRERSSCLSYDVVDKLLDQPNLPHLRESILKDFEEYFDAA
jgi:hypothetical protein